MILHAPGILTLAEYRKAAGRIAEVAPEKCINCLAAGSLRGHGYYERVVREGSEQEIVRIHRILCVACRKTFSVLFEFVVPWKRYSARAIATAVRMRLTNGKMSLRRIAGELTSLFESKRYLSHTTIRNWVKAFSEKAGRLLLRRTQSLCIAAGVRAEVLAKIEMKCIRRSAKNGRNTQESAMSGLLVVAMAMLLTTSKQSALLKLQRIFLKQHLPESIFGGHGVRLLNPQNCNHLIF